MKKEVEFAKVQFSYRVLMYYMKFCKMECEKDNATCDKKKCMSSFWNIEIRWEQKVHDKMKEWERRHPIMGIMFCTVLGGILVSLIAGIILEVMLMYL